MNASADLADSEIPGKLVLTLGRKRRGRKKSAEPYLAGSFRMLWIIQAGQTSACLVAVKLLQLATMRKSDRVQFNSTQTAKELGMSRQTLYRHLEMLEAAGLVRVDRRPGRWPVVQLLGSPRRTAT